MTLHRSLLVFVALAAAGCRGEAGDAPPANPRADPGALIACREFAPLAEREDKDLLTNEQLIEGMRKVREQAVAANPASDVARLSEQLLKTVSTEGSRDDRREAFQQLKNACGQTVK